MRDDVGLRVVSTKEHGLGIGLLLSRAALQRFGGRLELKTGPPAASRRTSSYRSTSCSPMPADAQRGVLVVDDDDGSR